MNDTDLKALVLQIIEEEYERERANRRQNKEPLHFPFNGIDIANLQGKVWKVDSTISGEKIKITADALVAINKAKYVWIYKAYTSANAPN